MELGLILFLILSFLLYVKPVFHFKILNNSLVFPLVFLGFIACLIIFSGQSFRSAYFGLCLWLNVVFPSLFPFFVASAFLQGTGLIRAAGILLEPIMRPLFNVPGVGSFAFAMGISSGYPVGAKITADLYESKLCTKSEAERLLTFTNNSSPLFITGAVAAGIFGKPEFGLIMLLTHLSACITVGLLFRFYKAQSSIHLSPKSGRKEKVLYRMMKEIENSPKVDFSNLGLKLGEAIKSSINTLLMIGGFIVLFCVIINLLINLKVIYFLSLFVKFIFQYLDIAYSMASPLVSGLFEITTGINYIKLSFAPLSQKVAIAAFILGWGGLSVHAQVASIVSKTDISIKPYLIGKFLQGMFASIYTVIYLNWSGILKNNDMPVFGHMIDTINYDWTAYHNMSLRFISVFVIVTLVLFAITRVVKYSVRMAKGNGRLV